MQDFMRQFTKLRSLYTRDSARDNRTAHIRGSCTLPSFCWWVLRIKDDWSFSPTLCIIEVSEFSQGFLQLVQITNIMVFFLEHSAVILFEGRVKMAGCNSSRFKIKYGVLWCGKLVQLVFKVYVIASHSSALKERLSSFHDYLPSTIHRHESHI